MNPPNIIPDSTPSRELEKHVGNGWVMLPVVITMFLLGIALVIYSIAEAARFHTQPSWGILIAGILIEPLAIITSVGLFTLQPNEARVLILFGAYKGTVRQSGFHWANPFYSNASRWQTQPATAAQSGNGVKVQVTSLHSGSTRQKVSLRARTLTVEKLKVNDKRGNPVEIAAVVVWRVADTAQALFDVDDYERYVQTQSESALRHLAAAYNYDNGDVDEATLLGNVDEVSQALRVQLQQRLIKAGVAVDEARLTNLSYAPEIAQAMLRRQQAESVIAARQKIVHGAVSMVEMALNDLAAKKVVALDDDRRAAMVSNLMVVLCGDSEVHPVVNAGTLYA